MPEYSSTTITPADGVKTPAMNGSTSGNYTLSALRDFILASKGQANGLASLDANGKLPSSQLPDLADDVIVVASYASLPATGTAGKIYITADNNKMYRWDPDLETPNYVDLSIDLTEYARIVDIQDGNIQAGVAVKAFQDAMGRAIITTYETKAEASDLKDAIENTTIWDIDQQAEVTFEGNGAGTWEIMERQIPTEPNDGIFLCMDSSAPSSSSSTGLKGQFYMDANYLYLCIADNTWRRVALSTF